MLMHFPCKSCGGLQRQLQPLPVSVTLEKVANLNMSPVADLGPFKEDRWADL